MLGIEIMKRLGGGASNNTFLRDHYIAGTTYADFRFSYNGVIYERTTSGAAVPQYNWVNPVSSAGDFEIRVTKTTGDTPALGTLNTWLTSAIAVGIWGWNNNLTYKYVELLVEIRRASDSVVVESAPVIIENFGIE
jgi:hypothetical protein